MYDQVLDQQIREGRDHNEKEIAQVRFADPSVIILVDHVIVIILLTILPLTLSSLSCFSTNSHDSIYVRTGFVKISVSIFII